MTPPTMIASAPNMMKFLITDLLYVYSGDALRALHRQDEALVLSIVILKLGTQVMIAFLLLFCVFYRFLLFDEQFLIETFQIDRKSKIVNVHVHTLTKIHVGITP